MWILLKKESIRNQGNMTWYKCFSYLEFFMIHQNKLNLG